MACLSCLGLVAREEEERLALEGKRYDFQCGACKYTFSRTHANAPRACPQCGKTQLIKYEKDRLTSSTLLDMV